MKAVIVRPSARKRGLIELLEARYLFSTTTINWATVNQTITGFGASSAFVTQSLTPSQSNLIFSPTDGAGLTMLRSRIAEDMTTLAPNTPQAASSWEISTMDYAAEANYQEQQAGTGGITVWSTPWSPPATWKTNQSVDNGGSLKTGVDPNSSTGLTYYQEYANYLGSYVEYIDNLTNQVNSSWPKINLYGISLQNEPDENVSYESCLWTASEFANFLPYAYTALNNLQGLLPAGDSIPKIVMPEASGWSFSLASDVLGTSLSSDVGVYAAHDYDGYGSGPLSGLSSAQQLWMTEVFDQSTTDTGIATALWAAQDVYNIIVTSGANAFNYWWIQDGNSSGNAELLGSNWSQQPLFWGFSNYSKFIRPGWKNIGQTNDGGLTTSAYANATTGAFASVLINSSSSPITETINLNGAYAPVLTPWVTSSTLDLQQQTPIPATGNGATFTYTIPPKSIVTLTGTASTTPVTAPPPGLTVTPSGTTGMSLAWTSNVTGATGYTVQRSIDNSNWISLSTAVPNTTYSYADSSLSSNTLYYYRVIANNGSVYSNVSYALTLPSPVTNLAAAYSTSTLNVTLSWTASASSGTDYEVERSSNGGTTWTEVTAAVANGTNTYTDTTAPEAAALQYQVLAINGANTSAPTSASVTTTVVRAPSNLTAVAGAAGGSVVLAWQNNSNQPAVTYIERSSNGGSSWTVLTSVVSGVSGYTDPAPGSGSFIYRVRAYYNSTYSAYSATSSFSVNALALTGTSGNNTFYLKDSGSTLDIWQNAVTPGVGTPTQTALLGSLSSVTVTGGSGNNSVTLDYSGGDPTAGSFSFTGASGTDSLTITGLTGGSSANLASGSLTIGTDTLSYTSLENLNLDLGSGSSTMIVNSPGTTPLLTLTIDSGSTVALGASSTVAINTIVSDAGTFNLSNQNESIDQLTGAGTVTSSGSTLTIGANGGSSSFGGVITGGLSLDKIGTGSFTAVGTASYTGNTIVNQGILTLAPVSAADNVGSTGSSIYIAPGNSDSGTLNVSANVNLIAGGAYGGLFLACNSDSNNGGGVGVLNQSGGSINVSSGVCYVAGGNTVSNGANGTWNFSGGTASLNTGITMSVNNDSISTLNLSGTAQLKILNGSNISMGQYYGRPATINQTGGTVTFYSDAGNTIGGSGSLNMGLGSGTYIYNLSGGTLNVPSITATTYGSSPQFLFNGGTLKAEAATANLISTTSTNPGSQKIVTSVLAGGAIINPGGFAVTIGNPLIHSTSLGSTVDGGLTVAGSGSLMLTGVSTYTGKTNVSAGSVTVGGSGTISTSTGLSVSGGAAFNYLPATLGTLTLGTSSTLLLSSSSTIGLALGDKIAVLSTASVTGVVNLALTGTAATGTIYKLLGATSGLGSASVFAVTTMPTGYSGVITATGSLLEVTALISTSTAVMSNNSSSTSGQSVTFTATVTPVSGSSETGTVQFQVDGSNVGTPVTLSGGTANFSTSSLSVGSHLVTAIYSGDSSYGASTSSSLPQTIDGLALILSGTNYLQLDSTIAGQLDVWAGVSDAGPATSSYQLSQLASISVAGTPENDILTIDFTNGDPLAAITAGISFNQMGVAGGSDSLVVIGDSYGDTFNASAGQLLMSGGSGSIAYNAIPIAFADVATESMFAGGGTDSLVVSGGSTLRYTAPSSSGYPTALVSSLSIGIGSKLVFGSPDSSRALLQLATIGAWAGQLDLQSNDLLVQGGSTAFGMVDNQLTAGYAQGSWTGQGITSSTAASNSSHLMALGVMLNSQNGSALYKSGNPFDGVVPNPADVLVRYTYYGDANLDGNVDGSDYSLVDFGYLNKLTGWFNGDFNYDSVIDGSDYTLMDNAFNMQSARQSAVIAKSQVEMVSFAEPAEPWLHHQQKLLFATGQTLVMAILG